MLAVVDQALDRLGDLELAAPGGLERAGGVEDQRAEEVDADQGQVRGRVFRLLDQAHDPLAVELGDAVGLGVVDRGEQDQRVGLVARGRS